MDEMTICLLKEGIEEIQMLRRRCELLEAKVEVVEIFARALGMHQANEGTTVDVAWSMQRRLDDMIAQMDKEAEERVARDKITGGTMAEVGEAIFARSEPHMAAAPSSRAQPSIGVNVGAGKVGSPIYDDAHLDPKEFKKATDDYRF